MSTDPPIWHVVADPNDFLYPNHAFWTNGSFTPTHFDSGASQYLFGPMRFAKYGYWALLEGFFSIPVSATAIDITVVAVPPAYRPPAGYRGMIQPALHGIWEGAQGNAVSFLLGDGTLHFNTVGTHVANAQWGSVSLRWLTPVDGE